MKRYRVLDYKDLKIIILMFIVCLQSIIANGGCQVPTFAWGKILVQLPRGNTP